jgi:hypothetical protein
MMKTLVCSLLGTGLLTCIASIASAQNSQLTGLVKDKTEAVIPAAAVTLTNADTGAVLAARSSKAGFYVFAAILPGKYSLTGEAPGFAKTIIKDVKIDAAANVSQDIVLQVKSTSQAVNVDSDPPAELTETTSAVSTVIDRPLIENMPLNGNSLQTLFELTPGVVTNAGGSPATGGGFSVDGQRPTGNYLTIDGSSGNIYQSPTGGPNLLGFGIATSASGGTNGLLPIDAIEEYRMQTSSYSAQYGRTPGGQIEVKTRGGTNAFHGSLFEHFRNQAMDAQDWFIGYDNAVYGNNVKQTPLRMNDFGGTFGGSIVKNHLFFFVAHESLYMNQPQPPQVTGVPNQVARATAAQVFQPYMNSYPIGNGGADPNNPGADIYDYSFSNIIRDHTTSVRLDANLPRAMRAFFRANDAPSYFKVPYGTFGSQSTPTNILTFTSGLSWTLSPRLSNEFVFNYSRNSGSSYTMGAPQGFLQAMGGLVDVQSTTVNFQGPGWFALGAGPAASQQLRQFNVANNLVWQAGRHLLTMGVDYLRDPVSPSSSENALAVGTGYSPTSLQSGVLDWLSYQLIVDRPQLLRSNTSLYFQDSWKVSAKLTVDSGLRWDYNPPPAETAGAGLLAMQGNPADPSSIVVAPNGTPLYRKRYLNFAPRLGFAYQLRASRQSGTVIRGGGGVFYDTGQTAAAASAWLLQYPNAQTLYSTNVPYLGLNLGELQLVPPTLPQGFLSLMSPTLMSPRTYDWSLTIDQEIGQGTVASASYVGNHGDKLLKENTYQGLSPSLANALNVYTNGEDSSYNALQAQIRNRLTKKLNFLASYTWAHALDTGSSDFSGIAGYASNRRTDSDNDIRQIFSSALHYAPSSLPTRFLKGLTTGWSMDAIVLLQTAQPYSIYSFNSGDPNLYNSYADVVPGVPLYLSGSQCTASNGGFPCPGGRRLNPAAFACVGGGTPPCNVLATRDGTSVRNGYRLFGLHQFDLAVSRSWPLWEGSAMSFRVDAFNMLNTPNFSGIDNGLGDPTFGMATGTYARAYGAQNSGTGALNAVFSNGGARSLQLGLRVSF